MDLSTPTPPPGSNTTLPATPPPVAAPVPEGTTPVPAAPEPAEVVSSDPLDALLKQIIGGWFILTDGQGAAEPLGERARLARLGAVVSGE